MDISSNIICKVCNNRSFTAKYEATYVYSYTIDSDAPGHRNKDEFLPFLFDKRDKMEGKQYIECTVCGTKYPCTFNEGTTGVDLTILRKAIRSDHTTDPEFFG